MRKVLIAFFLFFVMPSFVYVSSAREDYVTDELIVKMKGDTDELAAEMADSTPEAPL